jgi:chemotaxis protein MotB
MMRMQVGRLVIAAAALGCGMSEEEHKSLLQKAMDEQKALFDQEMKKMRDARDKDVSERDDVIKSKDQMIAGLEKEVTDKGGDLAKVRTELGEKITSLASAKSELAASQEELVQLRRLREQAEREAAQQRQLAEKLKGMIDAGQLQVVTRKGRLMLKLPDDILFPSGSKALKKEGKTALEQVAAVLREVGDRDFIVAGHTDNIPTKKGGAFKNNWDLSTARAVEVVQLMIKAGVNPERLSGAGFGEFDPIGDNASPDGRQKNRRLEIILMPKIQEI